MTRKYFVLISQPGVFANFFLKSKKRLLINRFFYVAHYHAFPICHNSVVSANEKKIYECNSSQSIEPWLRARQSSSQSKLFIQWEFYWSMKIFEWAWDIFWQGMRSKEYRVICFWRDFLYLANWENCFYVYPIWGNICCIWANILSTVFTI